MKRARALLFSEVDRVFELVNGILWRREYTSKRGWRIPRKPVKNYTTPNSGTRCRYIAIYVNDRLDLVHRILWVLYHKKNIPENMFIDHIDGNTSNNSIDNLRLTDNRGNCQNKKNHRDGHLVGTKLRPSGKWVARITIDRKQIHIGTFTTKEQAHEAYLNVLKGLSNDSICD